MTEKDIIQDYREDWFSRCIDIKELNYSALNGMKVYWNGLKYRNELSECMSRVFSHVNEKYAPDFHVDTDAENINGISLVWDLKSQPLDENDRKSLCGIKNPVVYVTDYEGFKNVNSGNCVILLCKNLFGAGLSNDGTPKKDNSTNVFDFFAAQLFALTKLKTIPCGVYYCGYGNSNAGNAKCLCEMGYSHVISFEDGMYMYEFSKEYPDKRFFFGNTYNGHLQLLHELLFKCLLEFDRICKKHNIKYFLGGGTLLGAVRHKGMIPWDDDMDVMMLRPDYDKFLSVVDNEISDGMFFQSNKTDKQYHSVFTKIRLDGTKFVTRFSCRFPQMHQGVFIDIFVHDHTSNNKLGQKLHVFETLFVRSMVFHKWEGTPMHFYGRLKLVCKLATSYINKHSFEHLERIQDKVIQKYNNKNTEYLYDGTGEHLRHGAFPAKWLYNVKDVEFNGKLFPAPEKSEEYLEYSYGDYKTWIPASLRKAGHDIIEVDFGKYENKY